MSLEQAQRWLERSNEHLERTEEGAREAHREYLDAKNLLVRVRQAVSLITGVGLVVCFYCNRIMLTSCVYFFNTLYTHIHVSVHIYPFTEFSRGGDDGWPCHCW